jgi:prephenate dehydratase
MNIKTNRIAFQGDFGANSDMACRDMFPTMEPLPCQTFEDAFVAVDNGEADLAMIPIENTIAGRVADIHHLLPESRLHIIGEYFMPIRFQLMVLPGVTKDEIRTVHSHIHALGQCRKIVRANGWKAVVAGDTAGAAKLVAGNRRPLDGGTCTASRRRSVQASISSPRMSRIRKTT